MMPPVLRELPCPPAWTAAVLEAPLPLEANGRQTYLDAVAALLARLTPFRRAFSEEVLLQFDRMRPDKEIARMQAHARYWQPEIGLGLWLHQGPPTAWTKEEFLAAAPGELRPVAYRVLRVRPEAGTQSSASAALLGSGCLLRVATAHAGRFLAGSTAFFGSRIVDPSLTGYPFYAPLLTARSLLRPHADFTAPLDEWLPDVDGYLRESSEDGGMLILVRQPREATWAELTHDGAPYLPMPDASLLALEGTLWKH